MSRCGESTGGGGGRNADKGNGKCAQRPWSSEDDPGEWYRSLRPESVLSRGAWGGLRPPLLRANAATANRRVGSVLSHLSVP
eukprot:6794144-Prymnesium_polylepis.1